MAKDKWDKDFRERAEAIWPSLAFDRTFDAKVWKAGNSLVITIPLPTVEKFEIKEGDSLEVAIKIS